MFLILKKIFIYLFIFINNMFSIVAKSLELGKYLLKKVMKNLSFYKIFCEMMVSKTIWSLVPSFQWYMNFQEFETLVTSCVNEISLGLEVEQTDT